MGGAKILDEVPLGWGLLDGATARPKGLKWIWNKKSRFGGEYKHALVPEDVAREWKKRKGVNK